MFKNNTVKRTNSSARVTVAAEFCDCFTSPDISRHFHAYQRICEFVQRWPLSWRLRDFISKNFAKRDRYVMSLAIVGFTLRSC